jgi:hypothetical protein
MISANPQAEEESAMGTPDGGASNGHVTVHRTPGGWRVAAGTGADVGSTDDLLSALVLADLLHADAGPAAAPGRRPARPAAELDEVGRLRLAVHQLEHALAARVVVEQAIGVLAERTAMPPRDAFEQLRRVARSHGRKVHDLARELVASVTDPAVRLPGGLPTRPS